MKPEKIAIIGAGTMGHGIAQTFALAGFPRYPDRQQPRNPAAGYPPDQR